MFRPVERQGPAPVMAHQHDIIQGELVELRVKIPGVIGKLVRNRGLARTSHTDEVRSEKTSGCPNQRHDAPPEMRGCRIAVKENKGDSLSGVGSMPPGAGDIRDLRKSRVASGVER
jgi:hypothetical protein